MAKKSKKYLEIDENKLKSLGMFESVDGNFNDLGYHIVYTRIPGGLLRTIVNTEALDQLFIPMSNAYFSLSV